MNTKRDASGLSPNLLLYLQLNGDILSYHRKLTSVAVSGLGFRGLLPVGLTAKKGISITGADNLQYTRGSLQGGVVYECVPSAQGTIELWARPNRNGNDGVQWQIYDNRGDASNQIQLYKNTSNNLVLEVKGAGTSRTATISISTWVAGTWYHIVAVWDKNNVVSTVGGNQYQKIYWNATNTSTNGTTAHTALATIGSTSFIGQDYNNANQFNGVIAGRILNQAIPYTTGLNNGNNVQDLYSNGAGSTNTFAVTPDTVWLGAFSD